MRRPTRASPPLGVAAVVLALCCPVWMWTHVHRPIRPSLHGRAALSHSGCLSFPTHQPARAHQWGRWAAHKDSLYLVTNGHPHRVPDFVDCPVGAATLMLARRQKNVAAVSSALLANARPFHSLPAWTVEAACHTHNRPPSLFKRLPGAHPTDQPTNTPASDSVCAVVRFYGGQLGDAAKFTLDDALTSLTNQHHKAVSIVLVHTDASNIDAVHPLLRRHNDTRIQLVTFADLAAMLTPRINHRTVWLATDKAITLCPSSARWLLVTNGDNTYHPAFLDHLDPSVDIVAFDYHTRHHPTWSRGECDAYDPRDDGTSQGCLPNRLRLCETDVGAVVVNLARWRREGRRFSAHTSDNGSEDGLLFESLVADGWSHKRVAGGCTHGCLFDHNPNYHSCLRLGATTVWDDRALQCLDTRDPVDALRVSMRRHGAAERCLM